MESINFGTSEQFAKEIVMETRHYWETMAGAVLG